MKRISMVVVVMSVAACSGSKATDPGTAAPKAEKAAEKNEKPAAQPAESASQKPAAPAVVVPAGATKVALEANDMMQFNLKEIRVGAGATVALTLKHTGTLPKSSMGHNFVLLKAGADVQAYATAAVSAKDDEYLPKAAADQVLAATKLLGGGSSDTIVFKAPAAGSYDFICSFPGHYAVMKGKFIVE